MTNSLGRTIVTKFYYKYSPSIAEYIKKNKSLRTLTRIALTPIIYSVKYPYVLLSILVIGGLVMVKMQRRRR